MFAPDRCDDFPPIPLTHIDVTRRTTTNLENVDEKNVDDLWDGSVNDVRDLSETWTGETLFYKFFKEPPGCRVIHGRVTRIQKTTRPPSIWPEVWKAMSRKQRDQSVAKWDAECGAIDAARARRGLDPAVGAEVPDARPGMVISDPKNDDLLENLECMRDEVGAGRDPSPTCDDELPAMPITTTTLHRAAAPAQKTSRKAR